MVGGRVRGISVETCAQLEARGISIERPCWYLLDVVDTLNAGAGGGATESLMREAEGMQ